MDASANARFSTVHAAGLIRDLPIAMMTTLGLDKSLASRPMHVLEVDADGALWFICQSPSLKGEQLETVNLSFADRRLGTYVSISGRGEIVVDHGHFERLWTPFARPWFPEGTDLRTLVLLKIVPAVAHYWDAPSRRMARIDSGPEATPGWPAMSDGEPVPGMGQPGATDSRCFAMRMATVGRGGGPAGHPPDRDPSATPGPSN